MGYAVLVEPRAAQIDEQYYIYHFSSHPHLVCNATHLQNHFHNLSRFALAPYSSREARGVGSIRDGAGSVGGTRSILAYVSDDHRVD